MMKRELLAAATAARMKWASPFCITVDFETLGENDASLKDTVTIRHRDSMEQERVAIKDLLHWLIARVR